MQTAKNIYNNMMDMYLPHITINALKQANYLRHTQKNEAMNKSIASFAPKGKICSMTNSLLT